MRRNGRPDRWARTLSPYGSPYSQKPEAFTSIAVQVSDLYQVYTVGPLHVKSAPFSTSMLVPRSQQTLTGRPGAPSVASTWH